MALTIPFNGNIWFKPESYYAEGTSGSKTGWRISDKIYAVRWSFGDTFKGLTGISSPNISAFISTPSDPTLHVEWVAQETANSLVSYCCVRNSTTSDLTSLCFEICPNIYATAGTHTYLVLTGCKAKSINLKSGTGNEFIYTADFSVCSINTSDTASLTSQGLLNGAFGVFNKAGNVVAKNTSTAIATIVDDIDVTCNNNLKDLWDHDSPYKQACVPGEKSITGTVGLYFDDGGKSFIDNLYVPLTNVTVTIGSLTTYKTWTFTDAVWVGLDMELGKTNDGIKTSQKFTAKDFTLV